MQMSGCTLCVAMKPYSRRATRLGHSLVCPLLPCNERQGEVYQRGEEARAHLSLQRPPWYSQAVTFPSLRDELPKF